MRKWLILAVLAPLCSLLPLYGQSRVDSLKAQLEGRVASERLELLVELVEALHLQDAEQALAYGREAERLLGEEIEGGLHRAVLYGMGEAYYSASEYDSVLVYGERLAAWAASVDDLKGKADGAYIQGRSQLRLRSYETALAMLESALRSYEALGDQVGVANSLHEIGNIHRIQSKYAEALPLLTRSLTIREELGDRRGMATLLNDMGVVYWYQANYAEALASYTRSFTIREKLGDQEGMAISLDNIGIVYYMQGNYDEAITFYTRSLAIKEEIGDQEGIARSLNNIGLIHKKHGDYDEALAFYTRSLTIQEDLDDKIGFGNLLNNIGNIHDYQGNYAEALTFHTQALAVREEIDDKRGIAGSLNNLGQFYKDQGHYPEALTFYTRSLDLKEEIGDLLGIANTLNNIAVIHRLQGNYEKALARTDRALAVADSIGAISLARDIHAERSEILERQGRFAEALSAHKAFKAAHDSLYTSDGQTVLAELTQQYRTKEQQQQIQLLERDAQIQRLWRYGLIGVLLLLSAIAFLLYNRYRLKNRAHTALSAAHVELKQTHTQLKTTQRQLVQQEKMASLGQLTAGIAHEIKNPLNFVNNFARLSAELTDELLEAKHDEEDREAIIADLKLNAQLIAQHGKRADGIVQAMMQHASTGTGQRKATELNKLVSEHIELAYHGKRVQIPDLEVAIQRDLADEVGTIELVPKEIGRVLLNLLGNAFDAVHQHALGGDGAYTPTVTVSTRQVDDQVEIRVIDNGPGIPPDLKGRIFEPFFTTKPTGSGTGLGLSLSYDIVTQGHGGTLRVENIKGQGATFIVALPMHIREMAALSA